MNTRETYNNLKAKELITTAAGAFAFLLAILGFWFFRGKLLNNDFSLFDYIAAAIFFLFLVSLVFIGYYTEGKIKE